MNALDLADYVRNVVMCTEDWESETFEKVEAMLRQQQEQLKEKDVCLKILATEIEELKGELNLLEKPIKNALLSIRKVQAK